MAPFGTVIKNGILFLILTAGITYLSALILTTGLSTILWAHGMTNIDEDAISSGTTMIWLGLLSLVGLGGIVYMKSLSDVVEEGLIEF